MAYKIAKEEWFKRLENIRRMIARGFNDEDILVAVNVPHRTLRYYKKRIREIGVDVIKNHDAVRFFVNFMWQQMEIIRQAAQIILDEDLKREPQVTKKKRRAMTESGNVTDIVIEEEVTHPLKPINSHLKLSALRLQAECAQRIIDTAHKIGLLGILPAPSTIINITQNLTQTNEQKFEVLFANAEPELRKRITEELWKIEQSGKTENTVSQQP